MTSPVTGTATAVRRGPVVRGVRREVGRVGMSVLSDQQLAGVIMWVPAGGIYLVAALILLTRWIGEPEPAGRSRRSARRYRPRPREV